jgi:hypothetical protein
MRIIEIHPQPNWVLSIVADDDRAGYLDVSPYLEYEAFEALRNPSEFVKVSNGGYFIEWECGADLSADTIEARWRVIQAREQNSASNAAQSNHYSPDGG